MAILRILAQGRVCVTGIEIEARGMLWPARLHDYPTVSSMWATMGYTGRVLRSWRVLVWKDVPEEDTAKPKELPDLSLLAAAQPNVHGRSSRST